MNILKLISVLEERASKLEHPEKCEVVRLKNYRLGDVETNRPYDVVAYKEEDFMTLIDMNRGEVESEWLIVNVPF